ncbi:MAG: HdeD family acid-resistance protein [Myxococcaceae bacterium]
MRNWWAVMLRGLVAVLFGILALARPTAGLMLLVTLFATFAILSGVFALVSAVRAAKEHRSWGVLVLDGLLGIAAGVLALVWPGITLLILTVIVGFWALTTGIAQVMAAIRLRKEIKDEWFLGIAGALSIVFGVVALLFPMFGAVAIVTVLAIYALLFGFAHIALGYRLGQYKAKIWPRQPVRA